MHGLWSIGILHPQSVIVIQGMKESGPKDARCVQRGSSRTQVGKPMMQTAWSGRTVRFVLLELLPVQAPVIRQNVFATLDSLVQTSGHVVRVRVESTRTSLALQRARFAPEQRVLRQAV